MNITPSQYQPKQYQSSNKKSSPNYGSLNTISDQNTNPINNPIHYINQTPNNNIPISNDDMYIINGNSNRHGNINDQNIFLIPNHSNNIFSIPNEQNHLLPRNIIQTKQHEIVDKDGYIHVNKDYRHYKRDQNQGQNQGQNELSNDFDHYYPETRRFFYKFESKLMIIDLCGVEIPSIRQYSIFHWFQLLTHCLVLFNALISAWMSFFNPDYDLPLSYRLFHTFFIFFTIFIDLRMTQLYYNYAIYAPYSLASPLLYIFKDIIIIPKCPDVVFLSQKIAILLQGYLFVVLPYLNILQIIHSPSKGGDLSSQSELFNKIAHFISKTVSVFTTNTTENNNNGDNNFFLQLQVIFFYILLFQLAITLITWISFCLFYTVFVYEIILRVVLFPLLCFRRRKYLTSIPSMSEEELQQQSQNDGNNNVKKNTDLPLHQSDHQINSQTVPSRFRFITYNVYHNHYAYEQHRLNNYHDHINNDDDDSDNDTSLINSSNDNDIDNQQRNNSSRSDDDNSINNSFTKKYNQNNNKNLTKPLNLNQYNFIQPPIPQNHNNNNNNNNKHYDLRNDQDDGDIYTHPKNYKIRQFEIDQQEFIPITPYHNNFFASHISDPIMYKPYEILWILM